MLLHGLMGTAEQWEHVVKALASWCRPIALQLPILDPTLPDGSPAALAGYVRRFLDTRGIPRAVVGGNSLGGHVALELALAHPDRVAALVLTGSSGLFERSFTRGVPHRPTADWVREKMEEVFYDPRLVTEEWVAAVQQAVTARACALRLLQVARAAKSRNVEEELPRLTMPTCLIWGEEDRITPPDVARRFQALLPRSDLFLLARCGHAPMLEQPVGFTAALTHWLRHVRPVARPLEASGVAA